MAQRKTKKMIKNPLYLVPFDFTAVAESALRLGLDLAIANDGCVVLLHVSKTKSDQNYPTKSAITH